MMSIEFTFKFLLRFAVALSLCLGASILPSISHAESDLFEAGVDPRLVEIVQIIKDRADMGNQIDPPNIVEPSLDDTYLDIIKRLQAASYSQNPDQILSAAEELRMVYVDDASLSIAQLYPLHLKYAELIKSEAKSSEIQTSIAEYSVTGSWFEQYIALSLSGFVHANNTERQAALQKAQLALSIIPEKPDVQNLNYATYAKSNISSRIAHLHNLQGNSDLALTTSLEFLKLTQGNTDPKTEVDLINNLIYSYSIGRNHKAQLYLSEQLLEIEKNQSSSVPGLSEMRISTVMNTRGRFKEGLDFAEKSASLTEHPVIVRANLINQSTALAGLGRFDEARKIANLADVNFDKQHLLQNETRQFDLYLAFLFAQKEDPKYATQLFNRQLDVTAQKFLENNSRDTTAMLAELENSRERQAERDAALAREAELQAMTISRQRNINRMLTVLLILLGLGVLAGIFFIRYREKVLHKLEIKTREAASAEKLKTEFLGMISHELRTPLNGIIGISDYLANYHDDQDIRDKTGIVLRSGNELLAVVESLTDMARIDAGQLNLIPHDADLDVSLRTVPEMWVDKAAEKGLAFTHFIDPVIGRHNLDEDRLIQCLNILLANAISFTDAGRVHLHITVPKSGEKTLTAIVADTGNGMTETVQKRLFTPFMQADTSRKRDHMGTGLSLAIAYALIEMMGGKLSVVSREGRGSEFTFTIPLMDAIAERPFHPLEDIGLSRELPVLEGPDAPRQEFIDLMSPSHVDKALHQASDKNIFSGTKQKILIVDDIASNRDILRLMLEDRGFECGEAADGFTALAALECHAYDLVFLDIHMAPMDGIETLHRLRASTKPYASIPVIALTADNAASTNAECMEAGADLFLSKPVRREEITRAMDFLASAQNTRILSQKA